MKSTKPLQHKFTVLETEFRFSLIVIKNDHIFSQGQNYPDSKILSVSTG